MPARRRCYDNLVSGQSLCVDSVRKFSILRDPYIHIEFSHPSQRRFQTSVLSVPDIVGPETDWCLSSPLSFYSLSHTPSYHFQTYPYFIRLPALLWPARSDPDLPIRSSPLSLAPSGLPPIPPCALPLPPPFSHAVTPASRYSAVTFTRASNRYVFYTLYYLIKRYQNSQYMGKHSCENISNEFQI